MTRLLVILAAGVAFSAAPALAQRADLPPAEKVVEALGNHPNVTAAAARVASARARGGMLRSGPHEVTLGGAYVRRNIDRDRGYDEFDATVTRALRLPGKAALDREAGSLGVEVAENRMEDMRHQMSLILSGFWHDWLTAGAHYRNDLDAVLGLEDAVAAVQRRVTLRDAAQLDLDQAIAALAQARTQAAMSLAAREQARVALAASFPEIPLPPETPELALPTHPELELQALRDLVIARSHEIRAANREAQRLDVLARRARADRIPDPSFGVRLFSERGGAETGAGVVASIPLGGSYRRAAVDEATALANAARLELAAVQREIRGVADTDLSNARTRMDAWRNADISARSAGDAATRMARSYQAGQLDLADLLYARRQANDARRAEIDARSEADRALLKIQIDSHSIWASDEEAQG